VIVRSGDVVTVSLARKSSTLPSALPGLPWGQIAGGLKRDPGPVGFDPPAASDVSALIPSREEWGQAKADAAQQKARKRRVLRPPGQFVKKRAYSYLTAIRRGSYDPAAIDPPGASNVAYRTTVVKNDNMFCG
jgi:hypothetical protein